MERRNFYKKLILLFGIMFVISFAGIGAVAVSGKKSGKSYKNDNGYTIVTSFYPIYIAVCNIAENIDGVRVINLTENHSGCIHDYQLTTKDMRTISDADVFIMNGGGMEEFLDGVLKSYSDINIIDSTENISMLESTSSHKHTHENLPNGYEDINEDEDENKHNAHVWMSISRYCMLLNNITEKLCLIDEQNSQKYIENNKIYLEKLEEINLITNELKGKIQGEYVITFNDAFVYLTEELGMELLYSMDLDEDSALNAKEIAEIIDEIKIHNVKYLIADEFTKEQIDASIGVETGLKVIVLNPLTSGDSDINSYIEGMKYNIDTLNGIITDEERY